MQVTDPKLNSGGFERLIDLSAEQVNTDQLSTGERAGNEHSSAAHESTLTDSQTSDCASSPSRPVGNSDLSNAPSDLFDHTLAAKVHHGQPRSKWSSFGWLGVVLLAFGTGFWLSGSGSDRPAKETLPPEHFSESTNSAAVPVEIEPVSRRSIQQKIKANGTLFGFEELSVSARVEGRVQRLHGDVGDNLNPGELILEIDPTDLELAVEQSERSLDVELSKFGFTSPPTGEIALDLIPTVQVSQTRLNNAQTRYERIKSLVAARAVSTEESELASTDFRAAQAEYANQLLIAKSGLATIRMKQTALAVARQQLEDTKVRVPTPNQQLPESMGEVRYVMEQRMVAEGTLVRPGTEVCRLDINRVLKLRVHVPERHSTAIILGQVAQVTTAALKQPVTGKVTRINPSVDSVIRAFEVEIQIDNPRGDLKPGSFAQAIIETSSNENAATVPMASVVQFAGVHKIFLAENGQAKEMHVTLGQPLGDWIEIVSPELPNDALVVVSGLSAIADGSSIAIKPAAIREATAQPTSGAKVNQ